MRFTDLRSAAALGLVAGARSFLSPALLARLADGRPTGPAARLLGHPLARRALPALALLESLGDKLPFMPARSEALPLLGRLASGALVGAAAAPLQPLAGAAVGAATAGFAAIALASLRSRLDTLGPAPALLAALAEDTAAFALGRRLALRL
jgi:uncharacterized membrane protein